MTFTESNAGVVQLRDILAGPASTRANGKIIGQDCDYKAFIELYASSLLEGVF